MKLSNGEILRFRKRCKELIMFQVIKNKGRVVQAYKLQRGSEPIRELIKGGKITETEDGSYEVHSRETAGGKGEIAAEGDWIKLDRNGHPYPNSAEFFEAHHRLLEGDTYEQIPFRIYAWNAQCGPCPEIDYLLSSQRLRIDPSSFEKRYLADLWGTREFAAADAFLLFYSLSYDTEGRVQNAEFNFIEKTEFYRTYSIVAESESALPQSVQSG